MGVLKNITEEYFGDSMRNEEYVKFNTDETKPIDMGGSVLWADRDLEVKDGGGWFYYDKYFTYDEISGVKFKDGWRIPTFDEFTELYSSETGTIRKVNSQPSPYMVLDITFVSSENEELKFETKGHYLDQSPGRLIDGEWGFHRMTSDTDENHGAVEVFNCYYSVKEVIKIIKDRKKNRCYFGKENMYVPIRLVKDKK